MPVAVQIQHFRLQGNDQVAAATAAELLERGTADHMLQFAHVARPVVGQQRALGRRRQAQTAQAQAGAVEFEKLPGQDQHVIAAFAQRRNRHRIDRQTMVQIGAEQAFANAVRQVAVGGGNDAHIHMQRLVRPQALDLAVLQGAQQFGLHAQGQLADFVEKQRAAIGRIETPGAVTVGTGEGTFDVAEQLAFGQ
ncbi:hypothetical protein D3C79_701920 [compost metagenome]